MSHLLVGDPSRFAIESFFSQPLERPSQRALGYFLVHVGGRVYGVRSSEATLLACSFDAVNRRLARRGRHAVSFSMEPAETVVLAVQAALYAEASKDEQFWAMSADELNDDLVSHEIMLAPDGDEAFDDGSHILQFDQGDRVRLIAFKNTSDAKSTTDSMAEATLSAAEFYRVLEDWRARFELARLSALSAQTK